MSNSVEAAIASPIRECFGLDSPFEWVVMRIVASLKANDFAVVDVRDYDALHDEVERLTEVNKKLKLQIRQQPSNSKKLTKGEAKQIRDMYRKGYKVTELAAIFDVNHSTVSRIVKHVYWKGI